VVAGRDAHPESSARGPVALANLIDDVVQGLQVERPMPTATLDVDATHAASRKAEALRCYDGYRAVQPQMARCPRGRGAGGRASVNYPPIRLHPVSARRAHEGG